jgi:hypothetical protein
MAKLRYKAFRKAHPKRDRSRDVAQAREAKYWERFGEVEEQGFGPIPMLATAILGGELYRVVRGTLRTLQKSTRKAEKTMDIVADIKDHLLKVSKSAEKFLGILYHIPVALLGFWLFDQVQSPVFRLGLIAALSALFGKQLWDLIKEHFVVVQPQSDVSGLSTLLATILTFSFLPKDGPRLVPELLRRMPTLPRTMASFDELFRAGLGFVEVAYNHLRALFGKEAQYFGDQVVVNIKKWRSEAEALEVRFAGFKDNNPPIEFIKEVFAKIQDGYHLRHSVSDEKYKAMMGKAIDRLEVRLKPYESQLQAAKTFRVEPEFLLLYGASKQGKTTMLVRAATAILILADLVDSKQVLANLWQKGDTKYFESYCGQKCLVMDDVFQEKVVPGMEGNEFMQIIRMVGSWSYPLNMASVDLKAKFFFDSPVIIGTTNLPSIDATTAPQVIACREAVSRRVHRCLKIEATGEFESEGGLNYPRLEQVLTDRTNALFAQYKAGANITKEDVLRTFPWEAWRAEKWNWSTGESSGEVVDLCDYLADMARVVKDKLTTHNNALSNLDMFAEMLSNANDTVTEPQMGPICNEIRECYSEWPVALEEDEPVFRINGEIPGTEEPSHSKMWWPPEEPRAVENSATPYCAPTVFSNTPQCLGGEGETEITEPTMIPQPLQGASDPIFIALTHVENQSLREFERKLDALERGDLDFKTADALYEELRGIHNSKMFRADYLGFPSVQKDLVKTQTEQAKSRIRDYMLANYRWRVWSKASITQRLWRYFDCACEDASKAFKAVSEGFVSLLMRLEEWGRGGWLQEGLAGVASFALCVAMGFTVGYIIGLAINVLIGVCNGVRNLFCCMFGIRSVEQSNVKEIAPKQVSKKFVRQSITEQAGGFDGSQFEQKHNRIYGNTYKLIVEDGEDKFDVGQILFIEGHMATFPAHYLEQLREKVSPDATLHIVSASCRGHVVKVSVRQFLTQKHVTVEAQDLAFMLFDREWFAPAKKITKYFLAADQIEAAVRDAHGIRLDVCKVLQDGQEFTPSRITMTAPRSRLVAERTVGKHVRKNLLAYNLPTEKGMCGAPLMLTDPKHFGGRPILGIHIAGEIGFMRVGYAVPICTELLGSARKALGVEVSDKFEEDLAQRGIHMRDATADEQSGIENSGLVGGSFELVGIVDKGVNLAPYTKLKQSVIGEHQMLGEFPQRPAVLGPVNIDGKEVFPMVEGLKNYQSPVEIKRLPFIEQVVGVASKKFREHTVFETRRLFSFEEAVKGVEGLKIKAINRTTSAGFPYVHTVTKGKTDFFGSDGDYELSGPKCLELRERVSYILNEAKKGNRLAHICVDFLKDELRPNEKVDVAATRVISGSPLDYVVAVRVMFGAFIAASFRHHTFSGMCPGINPYQDWWQLVEHLKGGDSERTKFFDGDFKRFDASEQPYILWQILDLINRWYDDGEDNSRARTVLWMDLVHSRHLSGARGVNTVVVQWNKSLPSGHPLTTLVNSWYSLICLFACFHKLTCDRVEFNDAWEYISPATYGDDNITGVSDVVADVFNQVTVAESMSELFNLTYTSGIKNEALRPHKTLEECTFLKRGFVRDEDEIFNGWVAPLAFESFLFTSYYYKNNREVRSELIKKLDGSLGELCLHDISAWQEHAPRIISVMRDVLEAVPKYETRGAYRAETHLRDNVWF